MAANGFYLTMTFYYFYVFLMLIAALPIVFGKRVARNASAAPACCDAAADGRPEVAASAAPTAKEIAGSRAARTPGRVTRDGWNIIA